MKTKKKSLVFIERAGKPGGGKGILISEELSFTLSGLRQMLCMEEFNGDFDWADRNIDKDQRGGME